MLACDHKPISHQPQILVDRYRAIISSTRHRTVAGGLSTIGELGTTLLSERAGAWPADEFQRLTGSTLLDGTRVVGSSIVDVHALHACIEEMQRSIARNPDGIGQPVDLLGSAAVDQLIETGVGPGKEAV
ncbi:MAG: hypothetical protein U5K30_16620 [Acidimicrobiales bacterium]|nr:hypothetical protein [Acidimicrobiales bacterium]